MSMDFMKFEGWSWKAFAQMIILLFAVQILTQASETVGMSGGETGNHATSTIFTFLGVAAGRLLKS